MPDVAADTATRLVEGIWARDATLWTGDDEDRWLGWLDEPVRMRERVDPLMQYFYGVDLDDFVLLGMGGSSLAPEVFRQAFGAEDFAVLDSTHPRAVERVLGEFDPRNTLFIAASKSGTTLETAAQLALFWEASGDATCFAVITDPGSPLEDLARERAYDLFLGEPSVGGRYSALSPFGLVPAALMGVDVPRLLDRAIEMRDACRLGEGNPGLDLGLALGTAWQAGRDKVCVNPTPGGFGLWVEQLLAESTGKDGKGLVPAPGELPDGSDRQNAEVRLPDPYALGQEFFRWEFATAVAGSLMGINPFDQPNVQEAKDRTNAILESGEDVSLEPEGSVDQLLGAAQEGDYVAILAFIDPARESELEPLVARAHETGCVVTKGLGPRYLHSTGQLHKGGPNTGLFIQVVDDPGEELPIPGQPFGFRALIRAQAAGDYQALKERGRRIVRVRLEDL